jgi:4-hydroxy-2-oxoheptanedioate aldolase
MRWLTARPGADSGVALGTFIQVSDPAACEAISVAPFDFFCIDAEHSALGRREVESMVRALTVGATPCLVRTADHSYTQIAGALDAGAAGVLVPRVESVAQADAVVHAARFPPRGGRGLGPARATGYGRTIPEYVAMADDHVVVGVQIESKAAIGQLESIARVPGIDLLLVGPGDLSISYGLKPDAPELRELVSESLQRIRASKRLAGVFCASASSAQTWAAAGADLLIVSSDLAAMASAMTALAVDAR